MRAAIARGKPLGRTIRTLSRRYNGRPFKADTRHALRLAVPTLCRLWYAWRAGGEVPAAFRLNFKPGGHRIPAPVLVRFVNFSVTRNFHSCFAGWRSFCACRGPAGAGRVSGKPRKLRYESLNRALPPGCFRELRRLQAARGQAELELQRMRRRLITEIESRMPAKMARHRGKKTAHFQS